MSSKRSTPSICEQCREAFFPFYASDGRFCSRRCYGKAKQRPLADRFWEKVNKDGPIPERCPELGPCWVWTGGRLPFGYGQIRSGHGVAELTHRVAWELADGPIPDGMSSLHVCDTPGCVRNDDEGWYEVNGVLLRRRGHLFLGTQTENMGDASSKGRVHEGERHGSRTHPESVARGERSGPRLHPESVPRGESHYHALLTVKSVRAIRAAVAAGATQTAVALEYGVALVTVHKVVRRITWRHVD